MKKIISIGIIILAIIVGYIFATPYLTVYQMKAAAENNDGEALSERIDFSSLRQNLKDQVNAQMAEEMAEEMDDNPFAGLAATFGSMLIDKMVDVYVTPAGIIKLMKGEIPDTDDTGGSMENEITSEPFPDVSLSYESFSKFSVSIKNEADEEMKFNLRRRGMGW